MELLTLMAPVRIEAGEDGRAAALWVQPQIPGAIRSGRLMVMLTMPFSSLL